jgi:hypothetical protein
MSWPTPRGLGNRGAGSGPAADVPAKVSGRWRVAAEVRQVAEFELSSGVPAALVVAGSCLQALRWDGQVLFRDSRSSTSKVLHVARTAAGPFALVLSGERYVRLVDLASGSTRWRYEAPAGTVLGGAGSSKLVEDAGHWYWLAAPGYAEAISCFEILPGLAVRTVWVHDFAGRYDRGFGPVMIVDDVFLSGRKQVFISSRTGEDYGVADGEVPTERVVLGRLDGHLYQAVLNLADGQIEAEVAYRPDPGDYPCARPYGLLQIAGPAQARRAILVSCQVEEYYAATSIGPGTLSRAWGEFVEKDWPADDQELRPQTSSIVRGSTCSPLLITGHFDGSAWTTVVRSTLDGRVAGRITGHYFWGTVGSPGDELVIVSPAGQRELDGSEDVRAFRLDDLTPLPTSAPMRPVTSDSDELPGDVSFHALRRSLLPLADRRRGKEGIVVCDDSGAHWWDPWTGELARLTGEEVTAGCPGTDGCVVLTGRDGTLYRVGPDLRSSARLTPVGCRPETFSVLADGIPWLAAAGGGSSVISGGGASWTIPGRVRAVCADDGTLLAAVVTGSRVDIIRCSASGVATVSAIVPGGRPVDAAFLQQPARLMISERTGVHTAAVGVYDLDGRQVWRDAAHGPHPNLPMAAPDSSGAWHVAYDDHGVLIHRDAHSGELLGERDWTAAYTTPVLAQVHGGDLLLRLCGVHGAEALDLRLGERWRLTAPLWRYFPGEAAVGRLPHGLVLASASRDGELDLVDVGTGALVKTIALGPVAARPPVVAVDLTGDGWHEFVVGTAAGRLLTVTPENGTVRDWPVSFDAAVEYLAVADVAGDGHAGLIVGTADGLVQVIEGRP